MSDQIQTQEQRIEKLEHDIANIKQILILMNHEIIPKLNSGIKFNTETLLAIAEKVELSNVS